LKAAAVSGRKDGKMSKRIAGLFVAVFVLAFGAAAFGEVDVNAVFGDDMVLQRGLAVPVWGTAAVGEKVTVLFDSQEVATKADGEGKWMVMLKPLKASKTEKKMTIRGSNVITFSGVLVGEVWFCSGQSNMAGKFVGSKGRSIEPEVFAKDLSGFRFLPKNVGWRVLSKDTQNLISCAAYYFGIELYKELDVPVGLIIRASSGTPIQSWMPESAAEEIRRELNIPKDWGDPRSPRRAATEYNAWLDAIVPVAMRGAIWYQGERNAKTSTGWEYRYLLPHLIKTWREVWAARSGTEVRNFSFYYVQVPTQARDGEWPWLRDGMRRALDLTENTGMAVYYDYGPSLHPNNKQPAGERLALWALAKDYGRKGLVHCGPLLDEVQIKGGKAVLSFRHVGGGLKSVCGGKKLKFFEIAGKDGKYVEADARIEGDDVIVRSARVSKPAYVRYLFRKPAPDAEVSLVNAEGLPASPFMTDDFKPARERR
jgi:sialate O-acetylesterase